jgi:site-specific DNA-methyltransferase (adenine-specific)
MEIQGYKKKHEHTSQFGVKSVVYLMDCMEAMQQMQFDENCLAVVDPPYGINMAMGHKGSEKRGDKNKYKSFAGNDNSIPTKEYFAELVRVSKNQIVWGANYMIEHLEPTPCFVVWDKVQPEAFSMAMCEIAWTSFKSPAKIFKKRIVGADDVRIHPTRDNRIHPTQKPIALYDWIFKNYARPTDWILDTHLGSGSSRIASHRAGLAFVGFELDEEYFDKSAKRFDEYVSQPTIFDIEPELEKYEQLKIE